MANLVTRAITNFIPKEKAPGEARSAFSFLPFAPLKGQFGSKVGIEAALTLPAYYNAVDQISNDLAKLPKGVYKKNGQDREKLPTHDISFLIDKEPNKYLTAFTFHKIMTQAAINRGNGISTIQRNQAGKTIALNFVHPDDLLNIFKYNDNIWYVTKDGVFPSEDVIHIMGYTNDGITGISVVRYAANTLGISLAAQKFTSDGFENRGLGFGVVESEKDVNSDNKQKIENAVNTKLSGEGKIKTVMLDDGMKYKPITINNQEAQLIEQGKLSIRDICRFLNISPHKVKDLDNTNYSVIEMLSIEHASDSIQPWAIKFQQEYNRKLFTPAEKRDHYIHFNDNILLRADMKTKGEYYSKMVNIGALTRNEVRAFEELNQIEGLSDPLTPVNVYIPAQIQKTLQDE